ncbi:methylenetetrahydrofolate--tRNA-(uracil(54)-C(5))-methyltransferase (FADH(2)-oxidizing) TrmFO [Thermosyntropha sp.]|uniref:methylenetetrahydrofolate--tRNA-(uracil(54)- C(5))-methyltransferase (FADH(2)-oxidizing) TrmFO n=1 Tax=Thermosyntropha sp. TaxID=2740820 RepID=UPI0025D76F98|nr:methylenetetrahydrofolate--tRNA-(uracil(54)-C(5))-methyltransferase (FADH(2)-oxidizing) TrmFO [Thermosyntropha sp.]MBO8159338.1 methylenetetrahydrofolate--tRNA-(uracil(54)-C(5))-methyltransferase (FADH(2)-oxidizing) TrmFO [Thermosyntropha sp.]
MQPYVNVIGGGLAGSEAAFRLASAGIKVKLWEMRPEKMTAVHQTGNFAELVCSNSLKSEDETTAQGMLKKEMRLLGSLILSCADEARVPAGSALAVDRELFSEIVTDRIRRNHNIEIIRQEVKSLPDDAVTIVATGPLTSDNLARFLQRITGEENLYFYDAVAPSVALESLDLTRIFKASRYGKGTDDYYNCPMNKEEYERFYYELVNADIKEGHEIDKSLFFNACMPIEVMARRGIDTLRYGPMRPVGLKDPRTGENAYAVVQLRQEDKEGKIWGLVGFQTRLRWGEQDRIFRLIPGLENAEFVRYGVMHRNTYINSPSLLYPTLQYRKNPYLLFAGQITGVEGYMESAATGIIAGINAIKIVKGESLFVPEKVTMIGALLDFITSSNNKNFQPINANFGLLPSLPKNIKDKNIRNKAYLNRSLEKLKEYSELFLKRL